MGKLKAVTTIAESLAKGKKASTVAAVDGAGRVIAPLTKTTPGGLRPLPGLDELIEYEKATVAARGKKAADDVVVEQVDIDDEIVQALEAEDIAMRDKMLYSKESDPNEAYYHQTRDPDEYAKRYKEQLKDDVYSVKAIYDGRVPDVESLDFQRTNKAVHDNMQSLIIERISSAQPRWIKRVKDWGGGSPYGTEIQFHVDRSTNPNILSDLIQFEKPRELGVHSGTNAAAEGMISSRGIESTMQTMDKLDKEVEEIALMLGVPRKKLDSMINQTMVNHLEKKFSEGKAPYVSQAEWLELMNELEMRFGDEVAAEASSIMADFRALPTPNTTPTVFRGKNGLLLQDNGGFGPQEVSAQLERLFPADADEIIQAVSGAGTVDANKNLQRFIESKGYDHVVYHNSVEDKGQLSIINWNPDLQKSLWDPEFVGNNPRAAASSAAHAMLVAMGLGGAGANIREN